MIALLASLLIATNATPQELVAQCRAMIPADAELTGRIVLRNRRGVVKAEHGYVLTRAAGRTALVLDGQPYAPPATNAPCGRRESVRAARRGTKALRPTLDLQDALTPIFPRLLLPCQASAEGNKGFTDKR